MFLFIVIIINIPDMITVHMYIKVYRSYPFGVFDSLLLKFRGAEHALVNFMFKSWYIRYET